jgi:hypothetical protein
LVLLATPVLRLQNWFRWLVKLLRCVIQEVGIAYASSYRCMKLVLSLTKLKAQDEKMLLKNGFFTCATELVPLVGKVTALFYTGS